MKKLIAKTSAIAALALSLAFGATANAETLKVDSTNFPDEGVRKALESIAEENDDGVYEINTDNVDSLDVNLTSKDLTGVEKLTKLDTLYLSAYEGGDIVLKNSDLKYVTIYSNSLSSLVVNIPSATLLSVSGGDSFKTVDVSEDTQLVNLTVSKASVINGLDKLDKLENLWFFESDISSIDMNVCPSLKNLTLYDMSSLKSVDVSKLTSLESINISETAVTGLDLSACSSLRSVMVSDNKLSKLTVPDGVTELICSYNKLTSLKAPSSVVYLYCNNNKLNSLDVSKCTKMNTLVAYENNISKLNLKKNKALETVYVNGNKKLSSVDISGNPKLLSVNIGYTGVKKINTSKNTKLSSLYCYKTKVSSLNLSKNKKLSLISFYGTKIKKINLSKYKNMGLYYEVKKGTKINIKNFGCDGYKVTSKSDNIKYNSKTGVVTVTKKAKAGYYEYVSLKKGKKIFSVSVLVTK